MKEITVKRVAPAQLPTYLIFQLNGHYRMELGQFVTIYDGATKCLYVNVTVPEADVQKFIQYVSFEGPYINEDESNGGLDALGEYISSKYGIETWKSLFNAWDSRRTDRQMKEAKELAEEILPSINWKNRRYRSMIIWPITSAGPVPKRSTRHFTTRWVMGQNISFG